MWNDESYHLGRPQPRFCVPTWQLLSSGIGSLPSRQSRSTVQIFKTPVAVRSFGENIDSVTAFALETPLGPVEADSLSALSAPGVNTAAPPRILPVVDIALAGNRRLTARRGAARYLNTCGRNVPGTSGRSTGSTGTGESAWQAVNSHAAQSELRNPTGSTQNWRRVTVQ